ncbi:MAG: hypothetical protein GXX89_08020 [Clostridiales bacterium]|jgi:hypothetical protein|nr:hypothetical protein [Clostridiales bacterium]
MSLFNLIWIAVFLYFGSRLVFTGIEGINFGFWDEIVGIAMLLTAVFSLYLVITTAVKNITATMFRIRSRGGKTGTAQNYPTAPAADGFLGDFRPDIIEVAEQKAPAAPPEEVPSIDKEVLSSASREVSESEERLRRLREEFEIDQI